ncbi:rRNA maturation RNase YbeY [Candidatus Peregrinibacteria bacterium]|nr:rRNA maturation RNase YbeY [Candidatus Peregrinibacteria bacterium]
MKVLFFNHGKWGIKKVLLAKTIRQIKILFPKIKGAVHVIFVDDPTIHRLNLDYLKRDTPTDVLSFTYQDQGLLGELYISIDTLKKQAKTYHQTLTDELSKIFVHGFLHLQGFTHDKENDMRVMHETEDRILDKVSCLKCSK